MTALSYYDFIDFLIKHNTVKFETWYHTNHEMFDYYYDFRVFDTVDSIKTIALNLANNVIGDDFNCILSLNPESQAISMALALEFKERGYQDLKINYADIEDLMNINMKRKYGDKILLLVNNIITGETIKKAYYCIKFLGLKVTTISCIVSYLSENEHIKLKNSIDNTPISFLCSNQDVLDQINKK
jgi:orotate phosphoribosyltransferase